MEIFETATTAIEAAISGLSADLDPEARQRMIDEKMRPFTAPDGMWRHAPKSEHRRALDQLEQEWAGAAGEKLWHVVMATKAHEDAVEKAIEQAQEPAGVLEAWARWSGSAGMSRDEQLGAWTLDELRVARFDREFAGVKPSH